MERFRLFTQYMRKLPIPTVSEPQQVLSGTMARHLTERSRTRYQLHLRMRLRIGELCPPDKRLNQKLAARWTLDWSAFRAAVQPAFKRDIPVRERDDWQELLLERRQEHDRNTVDKWGRI